MAGTGNRGRATRGQYQRMESRRADVYVQGTAVRKIEPMPEKRQERRNPSVSAETRKNRERALQMNLGYVLFLTAAAIITVFMCVNYLQLQARGTRLQKEVTALETQLDAVVLENDANYNRIMANVDMENVKTVAMNELGMNYASKGQIVEYTLDDNDYVRQYSEVPEE